MRWFCVRLSTSYAIRDLYPPSVYLPSFILQHSKVKKPTGAMLGTDHPTSPENYSEIKTKTLLQRNTNSEVVEQL